MNKKKSQVAMEFILIATIAFMIIISGAVLLRNYVVESSDNLAQRKLTEASNELLTKARKMYFLLRSAGKVLFLPYKELLQKQYHYVKHRQAP